jgi:perosamine synthetase
MENKFINQMEPAFDEHERKAMDAYLLSGGWVTEFRQTQTFAKIIAEYTGAKYCYITANGTVSLSLALMALGVGVGDEVIVPDYTMVATANAAATIGAKVVFADIERETLTLDFDKMADVVTPKTKAVMLVSNGGRYPANLLKFKEFCNERKIALIEDTAQALGSFWNGKHLGTIGDVGSFSFSMPKIITTGQGGALITDNEELAYKIEKMRDFGREKSGADHYIMIGTNSKFTDIQAVIGIEQMKKLPARVERKKEMGKLYYSLLENIKGVELIPFDFKQIAPWMYDILCERRSELQAFLKEQNIGTREFYPPLHSEPAYGYSGSYPVTEEISRKGLWLPSSVLVTNEQIEYICGKIREFYER